MPVEARPTTPAELRNVKFKSGVRGYGAQEVEAMLLSAASAIEHLLRDPAGANAQARANIRDLRNAELPDVFRGLNRDDVNEMCERAAATIQRLLANEAQLEKARPADPKPVVTSEPAVAPEPVAPVAAVRVARPLIGSGTEGLGAVASRQSVRVALGARTYHVAVGNDPTGEAVSVLQTYGARKAVVVTQPSIRATAQQYCDALNAHNIETVVVEIADGEAAKTLVTVDDLCRQLAKFGILRRDAVLAVGGGVVGDITGFTASVYYRGIAVVQVPTTLLAMVDAAIGGKTAANLPQGKNLVGAFHQPLAVLCDPCVLASLSDREFRCGLGEVLKYALMGDDQLLGIIADESAALLAREPDVLRRAIIRSAAVKARFVSADELERTGLREHLNYGHTLAHAIETAGDHVLAHGEAVAVGLVFAGALASALERVTPEIAEQHRALALSLGLPVSVPEGLRRSELIEIMRRDKKSVGGLRFVLQGPNGLERVDDPSQLALDVALNAVGVTN